MLIMTNELEVLIGKVKADYYKRGMKQIVDLIMLFIDNQNDDINEEMDYEQLIGFINSLNNIINNVK